MDDSVNNAYLAVVARPRKFDEESVLKVVRDQFWATGFAGTSMDAIAAATGLGKGSLYGAFGDKRDLFRRVFDDHCTSVTHSVDRLLGGDDAHAFERLATFLLDHATASAEPSHRGCLLAKGTAELAGQDEAVAARSLQAFDGVREAINTALHACQRHGDVDPGVDPQQLAGLVLTVHRGIEALGKAGTDEATLRSYAEMALATIPRPANS